MSFYKSYFEISPQSVVRAVLHYYLSGSCEEHHEESCNERLMRPFFSFVVVLAFPTSSWATTPLLYSTSWFPFGAKKRAQSTAAGRPWSDYTMFTVTTASVQWFSIKNFLCNWYQIHLVMMFFFSKCARDGAPNQFFRNASKFVVIFGIWKMETHETNCWCDV